MVKIAERVQKIMPSGTLGMAQKAKELQSMGRDIISLSLGEPDFSAPENVTAAAIKAINQRQCDHYTMASGLPELRQAICDYHLKKDGLQVEPNNVAVYTGAKFALFTAFQTLVEAGDEVLIPAPYWVSYTEQIALAQGKAVIIETEFEQEFKVTVDLLEQYITDKTKILLLTSPSNPTGTTYSRQELTAIAEWAVEKGIFIISDEIYYELVYDGAESVCVASLSEEIKAQTLVINGLSKSCAMTGWRMGYAIGPAVVIQAMNKLTAHTTSNPTVVSQYAAIEALSDRTLASKQQMKQLFEKRIGLFEPLMNQIPGFKCHKPKGAFYLFVNISQAMNDCNYQTASEFCLDLLEEAGVACVSGDNFGVEGFIRLSCATNEQVLTEAARRMHQFVLSKKQNK
ncbi:Aspartate/methionine/tyrosine aminotransferase [Granulicatella balaenopterae]|uniref:Aminotransferase n=1 Tax=Granulicatella balaenopterae TaxID=137733 RepID=A0A1H9K0Q5_9LACT|nr:pyridoxal phosphate-dependent aminotransferase [Granulicatella balaenopterae]SEQ92385.1 Aspartate/methionine/tyrosine aminotransferase [Granulicatella balaenopterae]